MLLTDYILQPLRAEPVRERGGLGSGLRGGRRIVFEQVGHERDTKPFSHSIHRQFGKLRVIDTTQSKIYLRAIAKGDLPWEGSSKALLKVLGAYRPLCWP
jgi:hypothetical protein